MNDPIRVLLVDDQQLIRLGFRLVLEEEPDIVVVGEATDGVEAVRETARLSPDVVLMDVRMPNLDGIGATERIVSTRPDARILILTTFDLDEYAFAALQAGASGFLLKDAHRAELVGAVRAVHRGDAALAPRVTRRMIELLDDIPAKSDLAGLSELTERELEVFLAMGAGHTNAEVARSLYVSESTVKTHVGRVLAKLGARDRVQVVILAHRHGLIPDTSPLPSDED